MNRRMLLYLVLTLLWAALAVAIYFGAHEAWLGRAEDWKRMLAMSLCGLMVLWNLLRVWVIRQSLRPRPPVHDLTR